MLSMVAYMPSSVRLQVMPHGTLVFKKWEVNLQNFYKPAHRAVPLP